MVKEAGYDPLNDFPPSSLGAVPLVLVVNPALPVKTVQELIALAKAKPGEISYGGSGIGSTGHVAAEMFIRAPARSCCTSVQGRRAGGHRPGGRAIAMLFDQVITSAGHVQGRQAARARRDHDEALAAAARGADAAERASRASRT